MTSRDFGIVTLRNAVAYHFDGSIVPINNVYITSTNGGAVFSDTLTISTINVSTINGGGVGGGVSSIIAGTNISITGTVSTPIVNVDINSTLLMNGYPIYDNNTITIAAGSSINLSTLSTSIILDQATQGITMTSVPTTTIRGFTGTDDGILRVNGYVALYGSSTQLQIYDANGIIKGSLSYSYTDDDIHLNAIQLLDLTGNQGLALTSQNGYKIRFNTTNSGNLDADIEGSITLTAGYSTSIGNINLYTASTSIVLDQASQGITLTANNDININASTLINGSIKVASTFYDNNASSGTSGQVLTAGTGGQVVWGSGSISSKVVFTSPGSSTFTFPLTGTYNVEYVVIGGGGGGGGGGQTTPVGNGSGGGGGGGSEIKRGVFLANGGDIVSYTVGLAGPGGGSNANGGNGTNTTFLLGTISDTSSGSNGGISVVSSGSGGSGGSGGYGGGGGGSGGVGGTAGTGTVVNGSAGTGLSGGAGGAGGGGGSNATYGGGGGGGGNGGGVGGNGVSGNGSGGSFGAGGGGGASGGIAPSSGGSGGNGGGGVVMFIYTLLA